MLTKEELIKEIDNSFEEIMLVIDFMEGLNKENEEKIQKIVDIVERGLIYTDELRMKYINH